MEIRCWFCRRSKSELEKEFPTEFWDGNDYFQTFKVLGKICETRGRIPGVSFPERDELKRRTALDSGSVAISTRIEVDSDSIGIPTSVPLYSSTETIPIWVIRKITEIQICRICLCIGYQLGNYVATDHSHGSFSPRSYYAHFSDGEIYPIDINVLREAAIKITLEKDKLNQEIKQKYPKNFLVILLAISNLNPEYAVPFTALDEEIRPKLVEKFIPYKSERSFFEREFEDFNNEEEVEEGLKTLLQKHPKIGKYDTSTRTLVFTNPENIRTVEKLLKEYEENLKLTYPEGAFSVQEE